MSSDIRSYFDHYGTLITVLALVLIVTYAPGPYDFADFIVGLTGVIFSFIYLGYLLFAYFHNTLSKKDIFSLFIVIEILYFSGKSVLCFFT